jgi:hypothetical protein
MRRRRARAVDLAQWPLTLRHLIHVAEVECPDGHAEALLELTALALRKVPSRGIFDPSARGEQDLFVAIEAVADAHLSLADVRAAWRTALEAAQVSFERRDDLERTALAVQTVSDTAYFYAGLAFGLAAIYAYRAG